MPPVIRVEGLGKRYRLGRRERYRTLRESLMEVARRPWQYAASLWGWASKGGPESSNDTIWALKDVSLEINRGDVIGIIGSNGAGKSTLLKVLSRITEPTEGRAEIHGRVGSLLEVGTGFHPELSGRENVFLSGAILGMRRSEIEHQFDAIVGFAGVEQFIDTPVKHYSSGMYVRLGFAVAAHLETEILLVDEVLAVGDAAFQLKCLNKMSEVSGSGRTILFVSHNMEAVTKLCARGVLLQEGTIVRIGTPQECIEQYLSTGRQQRVAEGKPLSLIQHAGRTKPHNGPVRLTSLAVVDRDGKVTWGARSGSPLAIVLDYELVNGARSQTVTFSLTFSNNYNHRIASCRSHDTYLEPIHISQSGRVICRIPKLALVPGFYKLNVACGTEAGMSDGVYDAATIEVAGSGFYPSGLVPHRTLGEVLFEHEWEPIRTDVPIGSQLLETHR